MAHCLRTIVYVDGFNLYYGCLRSTPYKWLDLVAVFNRVLRPRNAVIPVKYFTARVKATAKDPRASTRQQIYLRALATFSPEVQIIDGHFLRHRVRMEHAEPPPGTVAVWKTEEKGSDVNLAVHLLNDAWTGAYECAVVVSNDSDLKEPLRLIQSQIGKPIGLITPGYPKRRTSRELQAQAAFTRRLSENALASCQLPSSIPGTSIHKPDDW